MYDWYFGPEEAIKADPTRFLIWAKRLLPRWLNGIPDAESLALWDLLTSHFGPIPMSNEDVPSEGDQRLEGIILETGVGASTLVFTLFSMLSNRHIPCLTWDINASRGSFFRGALAEIFETNLGRSPHSVWSFIPASFTHEVLGFTLARDLLDKFAGVHEHSSLLKCFAFLDSEHTVSQVTGEVSGLLEIFDGERAQGADILISLDDAYMSHQHYNWDLCNALRKKFHLPPVSTESFNPDNPVLTLAEAVELTFQRKNHAFQRVKTSYEGLWKNDLFMKYFDLDLEVRENSSIENRDLYDERLAAWKLT